MGSSLAGLQAQFDGVWTFDYWSGTEYAPNLGGAWAFNPVGGTLRMTSGRGFALYALAVRPGDVAASVPEPQTLALALLALGATVVARRRLPA